MRLCVVQTSPVKGNIAANISSHKKLLELAIANGSNTVIFPELSITGYEPELAETLVTHQDDIRLNDFQAISDSAVVTIGVGIPTKYEGGICISMLLFQPHRPRLTYSKKYIHEDEEPFFVGGESFTGLLPGNIALAICYELSIPRHAESAHEKGAKIYIASAVKSVEGFDKAAARLSAIASEYSMTVLLSNCSGQSGGYNCAGRSSIWNSKGQLLGQLNEEDEGVLIFDTHTGEVTEAYLKEYAHGLSN